MADKLKYIPNYNTQNYPSVDNSTQWNNQPKFNKSLQSLKPTNEKTLS